MTVKINMGDVTPKIINIVGGHFRGLGTFAHLNRLCFFFAFLIYETWKGLILIFFEIELPQLQMTKKDFLKSCLLEESSQWDTQL